MRLYCLGCGKSVSNELPADTVVRASTLCPECLESADQTALERTLESIKKARLPRRGIGIDSVRKL